MRVLAKRLPIGTALVVAVAVLSALPAAEAAPAKRMAVGHTSQGRNIRLRVQGGGTVKVLNFSAKLRCRDHSLLIDQESGFLPTPLNSGGRFSDLQFGHTDKVRFKGRVSADFVRGRMRVSDRWGHVACDSHWFKFSARLK
jgi:hypothetical protein